MKSNVEMSNSSYSDLGVAKRTYDTKQPKFNPIYIPFCCSALLPLFIELLPTTEDNPVAILYDLNNLSCKVERVGSCGKERYNIKVIGAIIYVLNARISPSQSQCTNDSDFHFIGCGGVSPIDLVIDTVCDHDVAVSTCKTLSQKLKKGVISDLTLK